MSTKKCFRCVLQGSGKTSVGSRREFQSGQAEVLPPGHESGMRMADDALKQ